MAGDTADHHRTIRAAAAPDIPAMSTVLAQAFADEPISHWLQPDGRLRERAQLAFFTGTLRHVYPVELGAQIALGGGAIRGAAVWAPPHRWKAPAWQHARMLLRLIRAYGLADLGELRDFGRRGQAIEVAMERAHPTEPHWYLALLGIDPSAQGTGVGTALVESGLARCDREGLPAYLECLERLVPYYERFGFASTGRIRTPPGAPMHVSMWRDRT